MNRNVVRFLAAVGILWLITINAQSQWVTKNNGLFGGSINTIAYHGSTLFAGTDGNGVFKSSDNGTTWTHSSSGLPGANNVVTGIVSLGNNIVLSTYFHGIFISSDGGTSWAPSNNGMGTPQIVALKGWGNKLVAATIVGIYVSENNGTTWASLNSGLPAGSWISAVEVLGNQLIATVDFGGPYLLNEAGTTWSSINSSIFDSGYSHSLMVGNNKIYYSKGTNIYVTSDKGANWTKVGAGLPQYYVTLSLAVDGDKIYAGTQAGLYVSENGGSTFSRVYFTDPWVTDLEQTIKTIFISETYTLIGLQALGVFRAAKNSGTWSPANTGLTSLEVLSLQSNGSYLFALTSNGLYRSSDNGESWSRKNFPYQNANSLYVKGDSIFTTPSLYGIQLSTDNGETWSSFNKTGLPDMFGAAVRLVVGRKIFATGYTGIYVYDEVSSEWKNSNVGHPEASAQLARNGNTLFAGSYLGIYKSIDQGATWTKIDGGLPDVFNFDELITVGNKLIVIGFKGAFATQDEGTTWQNIYTPDASGNTLVSFASARGILFGGKFDGIYFSVDGGTTWNAYNQNFVPPTWAWSFHSDGQNIHVGTARGVLTSPLATFGPSVSSLSPSAGPVGATITISGNNFAAVPGLNRVTFNGVTATVSVASKTSLQVTVPAGATTGPVDVKVNEFEAKSANDFCVSPGKPLIAASNLESEDPTLTSSSTAGNQWFRDGMKLNGEESQTLKPKERGSYTVQVTVGGCSSVMSDPVAYIFTGDGNTNWSDKSEFQVFPVPATDHINLRSSSFQSGDIISVELVDALGRLSLAAKEAYRNGVQIDLTGMTPGLYSIHVTTKNVVSTARIVIAR